MISFIKPYIHLYIHDVGEHGAVLTPAGVNHHVVPGLEQVGLADCVVNFQPHLRHADIVPPEHVHTRSPLMRRSLPERM